MTADDERSQREDDRPEPGRRIGSCVCLSGGGYRGALFHLGAVRRLNELGVLSGLRSISAVSGGAIVANLLADPGLTWPDERERREGRSVVVGGFEDHVAAPLRALCARNVRTPALASRLLPWHWFTSDAAVRALADQLCESLGWWDRPLRDNARDGPGIFTGATEVGYGVAWTFADPTAHLPHGQMGDRRIGYAEPPSHVRIADAVAASCAMPPFFPPLRLDTHAVDYVGGRAGNEPSDTREQLLDTVPLTDGGVYDDLAVVPVWRDHATVLVSDGGSELHTATERTWWGRMLRILQIATGGGSAVRLRWLADMVEHDLADGTSWSLDVVVPDGYPREVVRLLNQVRTDLDAFSDGEQQVLERHGYFVADAAVRAELGHLVTREAPLVDPQPQVADPQVAARVLRDSDERRLLGRW